MAILDRLKELDQELFLTLNGYHNSFLDFAMYWFSDRFIWFPFYGLLLLFIVLKLRWKSIYAIVAIILTIITADQFTSMIMKPYFQRLRPCHEEYLQPLIHLVSGCGGQFGFVSSHAANSFGLAMICWLLFRYKYPKMGLIFLWAIPVSYSRIYLGAHYPSDVVIGALIGMLIAWIIYRLYNLVLLKTLEMQRTRLR
ncbi:MAG: phosphatase PAP2 family protein [Bacteroidota bacterium]|nr:phosphatase PAP2 family protein [Bacteroidota bacterium]